jgi:hypothetical protein
LLYLVLSAKAVKAQSKSIDHQSLNLMKRNKNYFRYDLLALADEYADKALVFTGTYKHKAESKWITLSALRIYNDTKGKAICGHINLNRAQVESSVILSDNQHNRTIYFCGKITAYEHYGDIRGGIELTQINMHYAPIWLSKSNDSENEEQAYNCLNPS